MAQAQRLNLDRYWPLPNWADKRAEGMSLEHALAIYNARRLMPAVTYEPSDHQALRCLYEALSLRVYPAGDFEDFQARLQEVHTALQGGEARTEELARVRSQAAAIKRALRSQRFTVEGRTRTYRGAHLALLVQEPAAFLSSVQALTAQEDADPMWRSLIAEQAKRRGVAKRATEQRRGPRWRNDTPVSDVQLRDVFGLRAVRYGASIPERERVLLRRACYDALADLAHLMGTERRALGEHGGLSLGFGLRTNRTHAQAHYYPDVRTINLTRLGGLGSLAHEFGHALDHQLSERFDRAGAYLSTCKHPGARDPGARQIRQTMVALMDELCFAGRERAAANATAFLKNAALYDQRRGRRQYASTAPELFARAFELWISERLAQADMTSPLLVDQPTLDESPLAYPQGRERARIADAMNHHLPSLLEAVGLHCAVGPQVVRAVATNSSPQGHEPRQQLGLGF